MRKLIHTNHYRLRCKQRRVPPDACEVLRRHGEPLPGRGPNETIFRLGALKVLRLAHRGLNLWSYAEIAVVVVDLKRAITVFRCDDDAARRRWGSRA
jgi:hypothetical protein